MAALGAMVVASFAARAAPEAAFPIAWGALASVAVVGLIVAFSRLERRTVADAGLGWSRATPAKFAAGLLLGLAVYAVTLAVQALLFGPLRFEAVSNPHFAAIALVVAGLIATSTMEELVFRSYALWNSVRAIGAWRAQMLVAGVFVAIHFAYGWPPGAVLLGVLPSGILFGVAAVVSRGLAMPLGVHFGMVAARALTGESGTPLLLTSDTSGLHQSASTFAPFVGAAIPLLAAALLTIHGRNRH